MGYAGHILTATQIEGVTVTNNSNAYIVLYTTRQLELYS